MEMLCRPLEERDGGWDSCMSRRQGLKWDRLGYCSEPEQFGNDAILGKTQQYKLECKKRDNPECREMRPRRRSRHYGDGILYFKPCIIFSYLSFC